MEESNLSDKVYNTILDKKCVDIHNRVTPLDFLVCILAFTFDLNFDVSYKIVKENDYINVLVDRFEYRGEETKNRMEKIRKIINGYINEKVIEVCRKIINEGETMKILLSSNKEIIKKYVVENSKVGFIPTDSELDDDRWYMEKDRKDLIKMGFNVIDIDISKESKEEIIEKFNIVDVIFVAGGNCFYITAKKNILN